MAKKDVQIKRLFGNLAETENNLKPLPSKTSEVTSTEGSPSRDTEEDKERVAKAYRERVDAIHGKPTTVRLKPSTIQRVNLATKKFRVKKGDFYNFAINYFLDQLEEDPTILPVTPSKYDIDVL
ncbi:MAG: hypothetical protein GWN00_22040 [Aliifodinibius sp.]|nr:hypothetical protein [Fodinibius sp.]NIV13643.1 hypothetical protein [Fodinibius sp.]NIY27385.1 hypothetical protein [Fodinibius sp.]